MTPERLASIDRFARWSARRWPSIPADDWRQEAVVVALERGGGFGPIQAAEVRRRLTRSTLPVDIPKSHRPVGTDHATLAARGSLPAARGFDEDARVQLHLAARIEALRVAIQRAERAAACGLPSYVVTCGERASAGRYHGMHTQLAAELKVTPRQVMVAIGRYSRVTGANQKVGALRGMLAALEAEARS